LLVIIIVEIPELFLCLPPLHHPTEASDSEEHLNIPIATVPIRVVLPRLADVLDALNDGFTELGLGHELSDRHFGDIGRDCDDFVQSRHNGVDRIVHEYPGRPTIGSSRIFRKAGMRRSGRHR
jgi:hypothetical protein